MMVIRYQSNLNLVQDIMNRNLETCLKNIGVFLERKIKQKITDVDAVDTGFMRNSIKHAVIVAMKKVVLGTNCKYAIYVHEGTRRMRKRQFILDTILENREEIERIVRESFRVA